MTEIRMTKEEREELRKLAFLFRWADNISPGELKGVNHALRFAEDLVCKWLKKYKFKHWDITETRQRKVTEKMKEQTAKKIAQKLTDHSKWRSHGRSIKIKDLDTAPVCFIGYYIIKCLQS